MSLSTWAPATLREQRWEVSPGEAEEEDGPPGYTHMHTNAGNEAPLGEVEGAGGTTELYSIIIEGPCVRHQAEGLALHISLDSHNSMKQDLLHRPKSSFSFP